MFKKNYSKHFIFLRYSQNKKDPELNDRRLNIYISGNLKCSRKADPILETV